MMMNARRHRQKVCDQFKRALAASANANAAIVNVTVNATTTPAKAALYLRGQDHRLRLGTDVEEAFRQESNFLYLTAVEKLAGCHLLVFPQDEYSVLVVPHVSVDDAVWIGAQPATETLKQRFHVDQVLYDNDEGMAAVANLLQQRQTTTVHILPTCTVHPKFQPLFPTQTLDNTLLLTALTDSRITKEPEELQLMRLANRASSEAHRAVMRETRRLHAEGVAFSEAQPTAVWFSEVVRRGCLHQAYQPIVAYGPNAAVLHYNYNDAPIPAGDQSSFLLVDAGGELHGYAADITRTYPVSGRFTPEQKALYEVVLKAQLAVLDKIRAGVEYEELHRLAVEIIGQGLVDIGVLKLNGATLKDLCWKSFVVQRFFPHGLGHLIGLDVHDVGGYPKGVERIQEPGTRYLRLRRTLQAGFVITVEPGCYFIDLMIQDALKDPQQAPHIDMDVVRKYMPLGGVRIEDCVVVTEHGHENLTSAPKTVAEIEAAMAE